MAVPWLRILDTAIAVVDIARTVGGGRGNAEPPPDRHEAAEVAGPSASGFDAQLAGFVAAALKESQDRDTRRLTFERERVAAERQRAERALQLDLHRQAGDREIGRLRLLAGVAAATWIGTLVWSARAIGVGVGIGSRVSLGFGWLFLIGAIAASFIAQSRVAGAVDAVVNGDDGRRGAVRSGASGAFALWLTICGLVFAGLAALIA